LHKAFSFFAQHVHVHVHHLLNVHPPFRFIMSDAHAQANNAAENGVSVAQEAPEEVAFKVFAGNLSYATTDEGLKAFFAPVETDILSAQVIMRGTRSTGYGFVALATLEAAQKAVDTLDKMELDGRAVIVEIAKPSDQKDRENKERRKSRRPGRRGAKAIPGEVTEAEANGDPPNPDGAAAAESTEPAKPKKKKNKSARKSKKSVTEGDAEPEAVPATEAEKPTEADKAPKKPRVRKPRAPRSPRPAGETPAGEPSKTMLFVANLGFSVDDTALANLFIEAGIDVVTARVIRYRWGRPKRSKGYGFVDVGSEEEQQKAIAALEGKEVGTRVIVVKVAVNAPHQEEADTDESGPAEDPVA
jgi:RNA recognition motif-containing protein